MSRSLAAGMASILGVLMMLGGLLILTAEGAVAGEVCEGLDSGKIDTSGEPQSVTHTAPDGFLIDAYCVKAGSENNGNGPEVVNVDPPVAEITISHSSGKAVSHYSVSYVPIPDDDPSPTCTPDDQYNPCEPTPTPVPFDGFGEPTPPTCETAGSYTLPNGVPGVEFSISPEYNGPGTYTVTATLVDPENSTFPDGTTEPKSVTITVDPATGVFQSENPEAPCYREPTPSPTPPTDLLPGDIAAECVSNIPYLSYAVDLPEGFEADSDTPLTITFVNPDGEDYVVTNQPLSGQLLWPGASVSPPGWPGYVLQPDGTYVETDGNFAWTRAGVDVVFEVNPSFTTHVSYPPASAICNGPVQVLPTEASSPGGTPTPGTPGATVLPTSVDAGLSSVSAESGRSPWGPALVASGLAMLVLALGMMVVRRPRGSHGF